MPDPTTAFLCAHPAPTICKVKCGPLQPDDIISIFRWAVLLNALLKKVDSLVAARHASRASLPQPPPRLDHEVRCTMGRGVW
mgnify:CR=1 FL=1